MIDLSPSVPTVKTFTFKLSWGPENDCDPSDGFTRADDERLNALKVGPMVAIWGQEKW